jgi:transcriptional regulator with XRE-family HTH domain
MPLTSYPFRDARLKAGLSQNGLARISGFTVRNISRIESHDCDPRLSSLIKLADACGVTLDELVGRTIPRID